MIQERRGIVSKLEIEARMRENKAQAQVVASMYFQVFIKIWWPRDLIFNILSKNSSKIIFRENNAQALALSPISVNYPLFVNFVLLCDGRWKKAIFDLQNMQVRRLKIRRDELLALKQKAAS